MSTSASRIKKSSLKFCGRIHRLRRLFSRTREPVPTEPTSIPTRESFAPDDDAAPSQPAEGNDLPLTCSSSLEGDPADNEVNDATASLGIETGIASSDLWSAAYREAVNNLGKDINCAILKGENVLELFKQLEELEGETTQDSAFLRGVKYLHSIHVPLDCFRLALDLAIPLASIQPPVAMAFGVVKSVTAIAISISTADVEFAKKIAEMLDHLSYIDDCDTLGQKSDKVDIHKALVLVYQKLLEFYNAAFEVLSRKGVKLMIKLVLENDRLPNIIQEFLRHADNLRRLVQNATWEIAEDIRAMLYDHEIARWLGSEKTNDQSQHHSSMQDIRANEACSFLLTDATFDQWYQGSQHKQLVILGDTGCGKTVAMSFLIDELRRRNEHQLPQPKICYHYCQNDQTGQAINILCALTLSLLQQFPGLKRAFFEWYKQANASGIEPATSFKTLEGWFQQTLKTLDRQLIIIVDGLDECDGLSRNNVLKSLTKLSQDTPRLKLLLSSRPEEEILEQLTGMARIILHPDAERDRLIVEKTVETHLFYLSEDVRKTVTKTLSRLAQGSAIWTRMTVNLIQVRRYKAPSSFQILLEDLPQPGKLSELYDNIFSRYTSNDPENMELATAALEILAISRRPLSILELAWAVALDSSLEINLAVDALATLVDHQRIMSLIQPFISNVDFENLRRRQVKLVHQSVKEFIIRQWAPNEIRQDRSTISKQAATENETFQRRTMSLEARILDVCIKYLLLSDIGCIELFSDKHVAIEELPQDCGLFEDDKPNDYDAYCTWEAWEEDMVRYDPTERGFGEFFVYASCHWNEHYGAVSAEPLLPDRGDIENICQAGSTRLRNWTTQNCRPDCTIKPRFPFDSSLYDPLSITSLYGSEAMLHDMLQHSDFDEEKFLPNSAMAAADQILQWGDLTRLKPLLRSKIGHQIRSFAFSRLVLKQWSSSPSDRHRDGWSDVFDLVDDVLCMMIEEQWGNKLLRIAASTGCLPIIERLIDKAQQMLQLRTELLDGPKAEYTLIADAVIGNHVDVVEYLLGQKGIEAHLRYHDSHGENVLHLAARRCNPAMFQCLLPRFKDGIHQTNNQNQTALVRIVESSSSLQNRYDSAEALLSEGRVGKNESFGFDLQESLRVATQLGDLDMYRFLLQIGTRNPSPAIAPDSEGETVSRDVD